MAWNRVVRQLTAKVAIIAFLVGSLLPSLSQALQTREGGGWTEVCTALGSKWVHESDGVPSDSKPTNLQSLEHCPYCALHANALALPPSEWACPVDAAVGHEVPGRVLAAARARHAWAGALPRAPPLTAFG